MVGNMCLAIFKLAATRITLANSKNPYPHLSVIVFFFLPFFPDVFSQGRKSLMLADKRKRAEQGKRYVGHVVTYEMREIS